MLQCRDTTNHYNITNKIAKKVARDVSADPMTQTEDDHTCEDEVIVDKANK